MSGLMLEQNREYLKQKIRTKRDDGRKADEYRPIKIEVDFLRKAEGSARVYLGETCVIAGVKMEVGSPFPDTPNDGVLMTNAEFSALASPEFESGPPGEDAIELARVVDRGIRESGAIDTSKLCIIPGEKVWLVFVDIHVVNNDGNLMDAAGIAAISALLSTRIPKVEVDEETGRVTIIRKEKTGPLPVTRVPIPVTTAFVDDLAILDPVWEEEEIGDGALTITLDEDGTIRAMQKTGPAALTREQIFLALENSKRVGPETRRLVLEATGRAPPEKKENSEKKKGKKK